MNTRIFTFALTMLVILQAPVSGQNCALQSDDDLTVVFRVPTGTANPFTITFTDSLSAALNVAAAGNITINSSTYPGALTFEGTYPPFQKEFNDDDLETGYYARLREFSGPIEIEIVDKDYRRTA